MTRLEYDMQDRQIRNTLKKGIEDYKKQSDERRSLVLHDRGFALHEQNKVLKKYRKLKK